MQVNGADAQLRQHGASDRGNSAMFKSLLVPLMLGTIDDDALTLACAIAQDLGASVKALVGLNAVSPMVGGWDYFPAGMYDTLDETAKAAARNMAAQVAAKLQGCPVAHKVHVAGSFWLTPAEQAILHARLADLVVLGRSADVRDPEKRLFGALLLGAGRPMLVVPSAARVVATFERIVVAWKPTRESARALHDAMPFLREAKAIHLLTIAGHGNGEAKLEDEDADILEYFASHELEVNQVRRSRGNASSADEIMGYAARENADLIVAGGYGHARASEQVFGGVTRSLYERTTRPVLFSH